MSLPNDFVIQHVLMRLIGKRPDCGLDAPSQPVRLLQRQFSQLTRDDTEFPYRTSRSHFANRVQWAAAHLKRGGWIEKAAVSGRGRWQFTAKARAHWEQAFPDGDELLAEMMG